MTSSDITMIAPGGALARPKKAKPAAAAGVALINAALSLAVVQAMVNADYFRRAMQNGGDSTYLGSDLEPIAICGRFVDRAMPLLREWLPDLARAVAVRKVLFGILYHPPELSSADATAMLHYLFGAMGKRRGDEAAAKLIACCDVFSPTSNALGEALGLWKPVPSHPVILAIAIKQLMAAQTFEPAEAELREALAKVHERMYVTEGYVEQWLAKIDRADELAFTFDRPAWDAAYASVDCKVVAAMQARRELFGEWEGGEDEDGNVVPPSPRWQALIDLIAAKRAAEQAPPDSGGAEFSSHLKTPAMREAACRAKPAKRTRKPRGRANEG
jgi:hypothetical protein